MDKIVCYRPFNEIEVHVDGRVYTCCPDYLKNLYYIGNINEVETFDDIWYSPKAIQLRKSVMSQLYTHCNLSICDRREFCDNKNPASEYPNYPTLVRFSYDRQCNLKCTICRDLKICNNFQINKKYDKLIDKIFIPLLKNAQIMSINSVGELTASPHSMKLLRKAVATYPNLKFEILTNGLLFNESFCKKMGILNRMERVVVSMHAIEEKTYESIMIGSNFNKVKKNLQWLASMKNSGLINEICLIFVAFSTNYKEIPAFVEFAMKNGFYPSVWEYRRHNTLMDQNADLHEIWNPKHPEYTEFISVIEKVREKYGDYCRMPQHFLNLAQC